MTSVTVARVPVSATRLRVARTQIRAADQSDHAVASSTVAPAPPARSVPRDFLLSSFEDEPVAEHLALEVDNWVAYGDLLLVGTGTGIRGRP
jgi:hypothetical protein